MAVDNKPHVVFLTTEDWAFLQHRIELARALKKFGFRITVACNDNGRAEELLREGFEHYPLQFKRKSINPFREISTLRQIIRAYRFLKPDLVHHVALKPVLYGSIAAKFSENPDRVNLITGLGYAFSSPGLVPWTLRRIIGVLFRFFLDGPNARLVVQNTDDFRLFTKAGWVSGKSVSIILGSGVDTERFQPTNVPLNLPVSVLLPTRILWDKGIAEFVEASRILKEKAVPVRMVISGFCDEQNRAAVPKAQLEKWIQKGWIEWIGHQKDMPKVFNEHHLVALPSYREGFPLALVEAASCAKPVVTTNVPGCREAVEDRVSGLLIPVRNAHALADAIETLVRNSELRQAMGSQARKRAVKEFSKENVIQKTLKIYKELLEKKFPGFQFGEATR